MCKQGGLCIVLGLPLLLETVPCGFASANLRGYCLRFPALRLTLPSLALPGCHSFSSTACTVAVQDPAENTSLPPLPGSFPKMAAEM